MSTTLAVFIGFGIACALAFWVWLVFVIARFTGAGNKLVLVMAGDIEDDEHVHNEDCW